MLLVPRLSCPTWDRASDSQNTPLNTHRNAHSQALPQTRQVRNAGPVLDLCLSKPSGGAPQAAQIHVS